MTRNLVSRRRVTAGALALGAATAARAAGPAPRFGDVIDFVSKQNTTGFLIIRDRRVLVEENWPAPDDARFRNFTYGTTRDGALLEDVASQQKSFVSFLVAAAVDRGLVDVARPVSAYVGAGWSRATPDQEARIRVIDVLTMSSGLTMEFGYAAPAGTTFLYNTAVYAITKHVVAAAAKQPLETTTRDWLTGPAGMSETSWRERPAMFAAVGNPTGLVTSPRDAAKLGQVVLDGGLAASGARIVSEAGLKAMFTPSATNPAYGRLWWLNGSAYTVGPLGRHDGPLIPTAPPDLVAALGALDRRLFVVPSLRVIVVRMGDATSDHDFDTQLWRRLMPALGAA
jgi:CubicO group peptidase (beta-lactamase class C family)